MSVQTLHKEQLIKKPIDEVFTFFKKPENLAIITPPSLAFQILTPLPIKMQTGALIDYTIRIRGLLVRWTTMVAEYNPPFSFVDVQIRGPYAFWHHAHIFEEAEEGTIMTDHVQYILPFGFLGRLVHRFTAEGPLDNILEYRARKIEEYFPIDITDAPSKEMLRKAARE